MVVIQAADDRRQILLTEGYLPLPDDLNRASPRWLRESVGPRLGPDGACAFALTEYARAIARRRGYDDSSLGMETWILAASPTGNALLDDWLSDQCSKSRYRIILHVNARPNRGRDTQIRPWSSHVYRALGIRHRAGPFTGLRDVAKPFLASMLPEIEMGPASAQRCVERTGHTWSYSRGR